MKRISIPTALTIMLAGGMASADRGRHHVERGHDRGWSAGVVVTPAPVHVAAPHVVVGDHPRIVHRPVVVGHHPRVVQPPVVVVQTPPVHVDPTYIAPPPPPQIWIEGSWTWTGYNWQWIDGHYEARHHPVYDEHHDWRH